MAIVVIGGLITSTFLSLLVIPVVFTYVDDLVHRVQALLPKSHA
jgi:Cu/Ag efflux pump CusA